MVLGDWTRLRGSESHAAGAVGNCTCKHARSAYADLLPSCRRAASRRRRSGFPVPARHRTGNGLQRYAQSPGGGRGGRTRRSSPYVQNPLSVHKIQKGHRCTAVSCVCLLYGVGRFAVATPAAAAALLHLARPRWLGHATSRRGPRPPCLAGLRLGYNDTGSSVAQQ